MRQEGSFHNAYPFGVPVVLMYFYDPGLYYKGKKLLEARDFIQTVCEAISKYRKFPDGRGICWRWRRKEKTKPLSEYVNPLMR